MLFFYRARRLRPARPRRRRRRGTEYAQAARAVHAADPKTYLGTFSSNDAGWFAGLVPAGRRVVVGHRRRDLGGGDRRRAHAARSPSFWGGLVAGGRHRQQADVHAGVERRAQRRHAGRLAQRDLGTRGPGRQRADHRRQVDGWRRCRSGTPPRRPPALGRLRHRRHEPVEAPGAGGGVHQLAQHRPGGGRRRSSKTVQRLPGGHRGQESLSAPPAFFATSPTSTTSPATVGDHRQAVHLRARTSTSRTTPTTTPSARPRRRRGPRRSSPPRSARCSRPPSPTWRRRASRSPRERFPGAGAAGTAERPGRGRGAVPVAPYLFLAPALVLFAAFLAAPIVYTVYLSLRRVKVSGLGLGKGSRTEVWAGFDNYAGRGRRPRVPRERRPRPALRAAARADDDGARAAVRPAARQPAGPGRAGSRGRRSSCRTPSRPSSRRCCGASSTCPTSARSPTRSTRWASASPTSSRPGS